MRQMMTCALLSAALLLPASVASAQFGVGFGSYGPGFGYGPGYGLGPGISLRVGPSVGYGRPYYNGYGYNRYGYGYNGFGYRPVYRSGYAGYSGLNRGYVVAPRPAYIVRSSPYRSYSYGRRCR